MAERRLPQDGRSHVSLAGQDYDLRVSILPGVYGEAVVIRLQSRQMAALDLEGDKKRSAKTGRASGSGKPVKRRS